MAQARVNPLRRRIRRQVHRLVGTGDGIVWRPGDDTGLFGPGSAAWVVHGDFTAMMIGGISALLMQMLHPAALAGVWDHSDFRRDMTGRLRRTAGFIAGTTYGSTAYAEHLVARVRAIHGQVTGTLPDGTPYAANDPALLAWVHVVEADSFLRAHLRYRDPAFPAAEQDRYLAEMATPARALGAGEVPTTRSEVTAYYASVRQQLRADHRTREVSRIMRTQRTADSAMLPMGAILMESGIDLLPRWAAAMHGLSVPGGRSASLRVGALGLGGVLRWALADDA